MSTNHGAFSPYFTSGISPAWISARSFPVDIDKYSAAALSLSNRRPDDTSALISRSPDWAMLTGLGIGKSENVQR
jgi:hypothetical protein